MFRILFIFIVLLIFQSCKKQELKDDYSYLVGEYKCVSKFNTCSYVSSSMEGTEWDHKLIIKKNGHYKLDFIGKKVPQRGWFKSISGSSIYNLNINFQTGISSVNEIYKPGIHRTSISSDYINLRIEIRCAVYIYERIN